MIALTGCLGAKPLSPAGPWEHIMAGGRTSCANGDKYSFWLRKADGGRLVIFFQGDEKVPTASSSDESIGPDDAPAKQGGILDVDDDDNPFHGWSFLYIPACTGDMHVGDAAKHRGWQNANAALTRGFEEFGPSRVLVAGSGTGAFGAAWHAEDVKANYPFTRVTQIGDWLGDGWTTPLNVTKWGGDKHYPSYFGIGKRSFTVEQFLERSAKAHPRITYAQIVDDSEAQAQLRKVPNYRSYLACGVGGSVLTKPEFTTLEVKGLVLREWVKELSAGKAENSPACR